MDKPQLSDRQLTAFKHVMECGSVSAAANRMFVAQPSVTRLLKQLEHDIGFDLFERIKGRLVPTPEARLFYQEQCRLWQGLDHLRATARRIRSRDIGHLRLCAMPLLGLQFLPDVVADYLAQDPGTKVDLYVERSEQVVEDVVTQRVDIGLSLTGGMDDRVNSQAFSLPTVCLMPADHPLAQHTEVSLADLHGQPLIDFESSDAVSTQLERLMREDNVEWNRVLTVSFALQAARCVQNGLGLTLIDALTAQSLRDESLVSRPVRAQVSDAVYVLTSREQPMSVMARDFLSFLEARLQPSVKLSGHPPR